MWDKIYKIFLCVGDFIIISQFLPHTSAVQAIKSEPSLRLCECVSGFARPTLGTTSWVHDYVVHHSTLLFTTDLHCAVMCITRGTYVCQKCTRAWMHNIVFWWLITNMQIKVHNVVLYRHTFW